MLSCWSCFCGWHYGLLVHRVLWLQIWLIVDAGGFLWWAGKFCSSFHLLLLGEEEQEGSIRTLLVNDTNKCYCLHVQVFSVSLFWTGAVLCNTVHVIVSGIVFLVLIHGGPEAASMPPNSLMKSLRYAVTTSFGSICYGSLFTAAIRALRWEVCMLALVSLWTDPLILPHIWMIFVIYIWFCGKLFFCQKLSFRLGDSGLKLATMSVCFAVLISCSI